MEVHNCVLGEHVMEHLKEIEGNPKPSFTDIRRAFETWRHGPIRTRDLRVVLSMVRCCILEHIDDSYLMSYALFVQITTLIFAYCKPERKTAILRSGQFEDLCRILHPGTSRDGPLHPRRIALMYGTGGRRSLMACDLQDLYGSSLCGMADLIKFMAENCSPTHVDFMLTLCGVFRLLQARSPSSGGKALSTCFSAIKWDSTSESGTMFLARLSGMIKNKSFDGTFSFSNVESMLTSLLGKQAYRDIDELSIIWDFFASLLEMDCLQKPLPTQPVLKFAKFLKSKAFSWSALGRSDDIPRIVASAADRLSPGLLAETLYLEPSHLLSNVCKINDLARLNIMAGDGRSQAPIVDESIGPQGKMDKAFVLHCHDTAPWSSEELLSCIQDESSYSPMLLAVYWLVYCRQLVHFTGDRSRTIAKVINVASSCPALDWSSILCYHLPAVIMTIHGLLGDKIVETSRFICASEFLKNARFTGGQSLENMRSIGISRPSDVRAFMKHAARAIKLLSHSNLEPYGSGMVFWTACCTQFHYILGPLFHEAPDNIADGLTTMLEELGDNRAVVLQSMFYSIVLLAASPGLLWIGTPAPQLLQVILSCDLSPYPTAKFSQTCLDAFLESVENLSKKIEARQYSRSEYRVLSNNLACINLLFEKVGISHVENLGSWAEIDDQYLQLRDFLSWLSSIGVVKADVEIERVKCQQRDEKLHLCAVEGGVFGSHPFVKALDVAVQEGGQNTFASVIKAALRRDSKIFNIVCRKYSKGQRQGGWVSYVQDVLHNTLRDLRNLGRLKMTYGTLTSLFASFKDIDVAKEVDTLAQLDIIDLRKEKERLVVALSIIDHVEGNCIGTILASLEAIGCKVDGDDELREKASTVMSIPDHFCLEDIHDHEHYQWMRTLLKCLGPEHFALFGKIASGQCNKLISIFKQEECFTQDGQRTFEKKLENLQMNLRHDSKSRDILLALKVAHGIFQPLMANTAGPRDISSVLNSLPNPDVDCVDAACSSAFEIEGLLLRATAGVGEEITTQLSRFTTTGHLEVKLNLMAGRQSKFCLKLLCLSVADPGDSPTIAHLSGSEVKSFQSKLQYLTPARLSSHQQDPSKANDIEERAVAFQKMLEEVYALLDLCFLIEQEGHPVFQNRSIKFDLSLSSLRNGQTFLRKCLQEWNQKLDVSRRACKLLHLLTNKDLSVITCLLMGTVCITGGRIKLVNTPMLMEEEHFVAESASSAVVSSSDAEEEDGFCKVSSRDVADMTDGNRELQGTGSLVELEDVDIYPVTSASSSTDIGAQNPPSDAVTFCTEALTEEEINLRHAVIELHLGNKEHCSWKTAVNLLCNYLCSLRPVGLWKPWANSDRNATVESYFHQQPVNDYDVCHVLDKVRELVTRTMETSAACLEMPLPVQTMVTLDTDEEQGLHHWSILCQAFLSHQKVLPCSAQVLFCSKDTKEKELDAFFQRVKVFPGLLFSVMAVDQLGVGERHFLQKQQESLKNCPSKTGSVMYTCHRASVAASWPDTCSFQDSSHVPAACTLRVPFDSCSRSTPDVHGAKHVVTVNGLPGSGKSHFVQTAYANLCQENRDNYCPLVTVSVQDHADINVIIQQLLRRCSSKHAVIHCTVPFDCMWDEANLIWFQLFYCGSLRSPNLPIQLTLPRSSQWQWYIEISQPGRSQSVISGVLPVVASFSDASYYGNQALHLHVDDVLHELAAYVDVALEKCQESRRFMSPPGPVSISSAVTFYKLNIEKTASADVLSRLMMNVKLSEATLTTAAWQDVLLSKRLFTAYLHQRAKLWFGRDTPLPEISPWKTMSDVAEVLMNHLVQESLFLCRRPLKCSWDEADQFFCLPSRNSQVFAAAIPPKLDGHLGSTPLRFKDATGTKSLVFPPTNGVHPLELLALAFELDERQVNKVVNEQSFVLTSNFAFRLLLLRQHLQANAAFHYKLPVVIEGETGVGKTFLLELFTKLHSLSQNKHEQEALREALVRRAQQWIQDLIENKDKGLLAGASGKDRAWYFGSTDRFAGVLERIGFMPQTPWKDQLDRVVTVDELLALWKNLLERHSNGDQRRQLCSSLQTQVKHWLSEYRPKLQPADRYASLHEILGRQMLSIDESKDLLQLWLNHPVRSAALFFKFLVHPGITKESLYFLLQEPQELAASYPNEVVIVFLDEINTASCLGAFKELFLDRKLRGSYVCPNLFFVAAVNPSTKEWGRFQENESYPHSCHGTPLNPGSQRPAHQYVRHYAVHELPVVMNRLTFQFEGMANEDEMKEYIAKKIELLESIVTSREGAMSFSDFTECMKDVFVRLVLHAHRYFQEYVDVSAVSQRDIQRVFLLIPYFWRVLEILMKFDPSYGKDWSQDETLQRCIFLAIAIVYYFRLPRDEESQGDKYCRSHFESYLSEMGDDTDDFSFRIVVKEVIDVFVTKKHFVIKPGIALTSALKENIFCMISCIETRIPLAIVGLPGSSKTLSYHIVYNNMLGEHSVTAFCKCFTKIETYFYQCSEYSTASEIELCFENAIENQRAHDRQVTNLVNSGSTLLALSSGGGAVETPTGYLRHCVVFLDEAGLPKDKVDEMKLALKVFHQYLDERKVPFVALSNTQFDSANANRMVTVLRSQPRFEDLFELAKGCMFSEPELKRITQNDLYMSLLRGLCRAYEEITCKETAFLRKFHHRELIYLLRYFQRTQVQGQLNFSCSDLVRGLEETFGGVDEDDFKMLCEIFIASVASQLDERSAWKQGAYSFRNVFQVLADMKESLSASESSSADAGNKSPSAFALDSPTAPRFQMIVDEMDNDTATLDMMFHFGLLEPSKTHVFHLSDQQEDIDSSEYIAGVLAEMRQCLELPHTIVLVGAERIYGSLYELLNHTFRSINQCLYTNITMGPNSLACRVHRHLKLVVITKKSYLQRAPAPFRSRFSKFLVNPKAALEFATRSLSEESLLSFQAITKSCGEFLKVFHHAAFYGMDGRQRREKDELCSSMYIFLLSHFKQIRHKHTSSFHFSAFLDSPLLANAQKISEAPNAVRFLCAQLLQLMPCEHFVLRLSWILQAKDYFKLFFDMDRFDLGVSIQKICDWTQHQQAGIYCHKFLLYTRSASVISSIGNLRLRGNILPIPSNRVDVVNTESFRTIGDCKKCVERFMQSEETCQIFTISNTQDMSPGVLFDMVKCCIDDTDVVWSRREDGEMSHKVFVVLLLCLPFVAGHLSTPAQFLRGWHSAFIDTSSASDGNNCSFVEMKAMVQASLLQSVSAPPASGNLEPPMLSKDIQAHFLECVLTMEHVLVSRFCSAVNERSISCRRHDVAKLVEAHRAFYQQEHLDMEESTLAREKALKNILNSCPAIMKTVAERFRSRFSGKQILSVMLCLSRSVAQHRTFLSFADMLHEYVQHEVDGVFRKVLTELLAGYNFNLLNGLKLAEPQQLSVLELVPAYTTQDEGIYRRTPLEIDCTCPLYHLPFFRLIRQHLDFTLQSRSSAEQVSGVLEADSVLGTLIHHAGIVPLFISDYIQSICPNSSNEQVVDIAREYLRLASSPHRDTDNSQSSPEHDLSTFLIRVKDFEKALRVIVQGTSVLTGLNTEKSATHLLQETDEVIVTGDDFLQNFFEVLINEVWKAFALLRGKPGGIEQQQWQPMYKKWKVAFASIQHAVAQMNIGPGHVTSPGDGEVLGQEDIDEALRRGTDSKSVKIRLMVAADVVLSRAELLSSPETCQQIVTSLVCLESDKKKRYGDMLLKAIRQILAIVVDKYKSCTASAVKIELLMTLLSTLKAIAVKEERLVYLMESIDNTARDDIKLPRHAGKRLLFALMQKALVEKWPIISSHHQPSYTSQPTFAMYADIVVHIAMSTRKVKAARGQLPVDAMYHPADFPELSDEAGPQAAVSSGSLPDAFYLLFCDCRRMEEKTFLKRVSDAPNKNIVTYGGDVSVSTVLRYAASLRIFFESAVEELLSLPWNGPLERCHHDFVSSMDRFYEVYGNERKWICFFLSELIRRSGFKSGIEELIRGVFAKSKWRSSILKEMHGMKEYQRHSFLENELKSLSHQCGNLLRTVAAAEDGIPVPLLRWASIDEKDGSTPVVAKLKRSRWCKLVTVLTVFRDYFCKGDMNRLVGIDKAFVATPLLSACMSLLLNNRYQEISPIQEMFHHGNKSLACCSIIVHWIAVIVGASNQCGHFRTCCASPFVFIGSYMFGTRKCRDCISNTNDLRNCFDWNNGVDIEAKTCTSVCPLSNLAYLLNALLMYCSLFCHLLVLFENDERSPYAPLWQLLVAGDDIELYSVPEIRSQLSNVCLENIVGIFAAIQQSDPLLANQNDVLDFVLLIMESFVKSLQRLELLSSYSSSPLRQSRELEFQDVVDQVYEGYHASALKRLKKGTSADVVAFFQAIRPPMKLTDLSDAVARCQQGAKPKHVLLATVFNLLPALECVPCAVQVAELYFLLCQFFSHQIPHILFFDGDMKVNQASETYLSERRQHQLTVAIQKAKKAIQNLNDLECPWLFSHRSSYALLQRAVNLADMPLRLLVGSVNGQTCEQGGGLLAVLVERLVQINNNLFELCYQVRNDPSFNASNLQSVFPADVFDKYAMQDVCAHNGGGLIHIKHEHLLDLMELYHTLEDNRPVFDLVAIEQSVVQRYVAHMRFIDWSRSSMMFHTTERPISQSSPMVDTLCPKFLAADGFDSEIQQGSRARCVIEEIYKQSAYVVMSLMHHLSAIAVEVAKRLENTSPQQSIGSFVSAHSLQASCWSVMEVSFVSSLRLSNIPALHRLCLSHLSGVESLFLHLPKLLKVEMSSELTKKVRSDMQSFCEQFEHAAAVESLSEVLDSVVTYLLSNIDAVKQSLDGPLGDTLAAVQGIDAECKKLFTCIPKGVCGSHLKEFMSVLLQVSISVRERLYTSSRPTSPQRWSEYASRNRSPLANDSFLYSSEMPTPENPVSPVHGTPYVEGAYERSASQLPADSDLPVLIPSELEVGSNLVQEGATAAEEVADEDRESGTEPEHTMRSSSGHAAEEVMEEGGNEIEDESKQVFVGHGISISSTKLTETEPAHKLELKSSRLKRTVVCEVASQEFNTTRKKLLETACKEFHMEESECCLTDCIGRYLAASEVNAGNPMEFTLLPLSRTVTVKFHHIGSDDSPASMVFSRTALCKGVCQAALLQFEYESNCLACLCTMQGEVLADDNCLGDILETDASKELELILCCGLCVEVSFESTAPDTSSSSLMNCWVAPLCTARDVIDFASSRIPELENRKPFLKCNDEPLGTDEKLLHQAEDPISPLYLELTYD